MTWKDRLLGVPQQPRPNPYESDPVRLVPLDREAAEEKWRADAEVLEAHAESPLFARTVLDLGNPLPTDYIRAIEPFVLHQRLDPRHHLDELDGPTFRKEVAA